MGGTAGTMEYVYDLGAGAISSGAIPFTNAEGGIPENFSFYVGVGTQTTGTDGGTAHVEFNNFVVPAPGAAVLRGLGGLFASRRRR
jgi:hypothetical protein